MWVPVILLVCCRRFISILSQSILSLISFIGPRQSGATLIHFVSHSFDVQPNAYLKHLTRQKETPTGIVETVEGFEPKFKANVVFGADWLEFDPDQKHARINMKAIAR